MQSSAQAQSSMANAWESFFEELSSFLRSAERQSISRSASESYCYHVLEKITVYCSSITSLLEHMQGTVDGDGIISDRESSIIRYYITLLGEIFQYLQSIAREWDSHLDEIYSGLHSSYQVTTVSAHICGRPRFNISRDQLEYLCSMSFSWTKIASMLGVSRMTIYRRRVEYGITSSGSNLSDGDLMSILQQISSEQPAMGETMMWGRLKSMGFHVTRSQLRVAIREVDPIQRALRWNTQLARRQPYSVPGPNSLWHIGESPDHCYNIGCIWLISLSL